MASIASMASVASMTTPLRADLIIGGGGVKGIGLAKAVRSLDEPGDAFPWALDTLLSDQDNAYADEPCAVRRTIVVPIDDLSAGDAGLATSHSQDGYAARLAAGRAFLAGWDFAASVAAGRTGQQATRPVSGGREPG